MPLRWAFALLVLLAPTTHGWGASAPARTEGAPAPAPLTLDEAVRRALDASLDVQAARHAVEAARAGVAVAGERPNPDLAVEKAKETPHESLTVSLPVETGGKRQRRVALAEASVRIAEAELARASAEVRLATRRAFFGLASAEREAVLRDQQLALATRVRAAAKDRFEAGDRPRLDLVEAQLALAEAEAEADAARGAVGAARATLAVLLGEPAASTAAPLVVAADFAGRSLPPRSTLAELAMASSVEIVRSAQEVEEQRARLALARAERVPDVTVDGAVTHDSPPEFLWGWRAGLAVTVPLFHHGAAEVEVEQRTLDERESELAAAKRRVEGALARSLALVEATGQTARRYREQVLPQTEEVDRMAEDSYRTGQTGVEALLLALVATRETRVKAIRADRDYQEALAELEQVVGAPLP